MIHRRVGRAPSLALAAAILVSATVGACSSGGGHTGTRAGGTSPTSAGSAAPAEATTAPAPVAPAIGVASWQLPVPLSREVVVADGNGLLVLGGLDRSRVSTASVYHIDLPTGVARRTGTLAQPVHDAAGVMLGGTALVFGGGEAHTIDLVQSFRDRAAVAGRLPRPRSDLVAATAGGRAWVLGGFDGTRGLPEVLATTDGAHFAALGTLAVTVRYPAVAVAGGTIWLFGGEHNGAQTDAVQAVDARTGAARLAAHLPGPLAHAAAFVLGGHVFVVGGRTGTTTTDRVWRFDPVTATFADAGRLPAPVADAAAATVGDTAWLLGGERPLPVATVVEFRLTR